MFAAGVTAAFVTSAGSSDVTLRLAIRGVLTGLWFLVGFQLAIIVAAVLAIRTGGAGLLGASAVSVVVAVYVVAAYSPVSRRILEFTTPVVGAPPPDRLVDGLTLREREVLALIAEGHSNARIAASLDVSERTVDSHVTAIFDKLGLDRASDVNRRVQAAAAWLGAEPRTEARAA